MQSRRDGSRRRQAMPRPSTQVSPSYLWDPEPSPTSLRRKAVELLSWSAVGRDLCHCDDATALGCQAAATSTGLAAACPSRDERPGGARTPRSSPPRTGGASTKPSRQDAREGTRPSRVRRPEGPESGRARAEAGGAKVRPSLRRPPGSCQSNHPGGSQFRPSPAFTRPVRSRCPDGQASGVRGLCISAVRTALHL